MIEIFVNNFIKPKYRERLIYELKSCKTDKREKAFAKLLDYSDYFLDNLIKIDMTYKTDEEIIGILNSSFKLHKGYSLKNNCNNELSKLVIEAINSNMIDIIFVDERTVIYIGETYSNKVNKSASAKFVLQK